MVELITQASLILHVHDALQESQFDLVQATIQSCPAFMLAAIAEHQQPIWWGHDLTLHPCREQDQLANYYRKG